MRYIILNGIGPILFADNVDHGTIAYSINDLAYGEGNELVAGGDVEIEQFDNSLRVNCSGRAIGIKGIGNRGVEDAELIRDMFSKN